MEVWVSVHEQIQTFLDVSFTSGKPDLFVPLLIGVQVRWSLLPGPPAEVFDTWTGQEVVFIAPTSPQCDTKYLVTAPSLSPEHSHSQQRFGGDGLVFE